ncbi:hypothetical protein O181_029346 [Austropuccinia psidii MF-1]|uniref:alpha-1,2-Mannosidase n=1 Tax=Austropuccinia psidii MF-1 TaxID=1389203 RepID=A0A9Q3CQV6_9BASI|nr:hypothetical protein [Austropuccinia psidii MF-1]
MDNNFLPSSLPELPASAWAGLLRSRLRSLLPLAFISILGFSIYLFFSSLSPFSFDPSRELGHPHFRLDGFNRVGHPDFANPAAWAPPGESSQTVLRDVKSYQPEELMRLPILHRTSPDPFDPVNNFQSLRDPKSPWLAHTPTGAVLLNRLSRNRFPPEDAVDHMRGSSPPSPPVWPPSRILRAQAPNRKTPISKESIIGLNTSFSWTGRGSIHAGQLPNVQWSGFNQKDWELESDRMVRLERRGWVRRAFQHVWEGYKANAWGHDELKPISGSFGDPFSGWGATLIDCLDTLLIMNLMSEYNYARTHVKAVDWAHTFDRTQLVSSGSEPNQPTIPFFETVIRYVGGLISAYDLSGDQLMLDRVEDLVDWLLPAFGTSSGLPVVRYQMGLNPQGGSFGSVCLAEIGSLTLEFTRLAQLTSKDYYYDLVQRITDLLDGPQWKSPHRLGTLFPTFINPQAPAQLTGEYTLGAMADSYYEYLIKEHQLLRGTNSQYSKMFISAIDSARKHLLKHVELEPPGGKNLTVIGDMSWGIFKPSVDHLTCFSGAMIGLGAQLLDRKQDLNLALGHTDTCVWAYEVTRTGLGPERMSIIDEKVPTRWKPVAHEGKVYRELKASPLPGATIADSRYLGRPETIESVFYMWRITGDKQWQDRGWRMFTSWMESCITKHGFADLREVNMLPPQGSDKEESFVLAETLKYYYLLFSEPGFISLDDYVFNTEAHPFLIPSANKKGKTYWTGTDPNIDKLYDPPDVGPEDRGYGTFLQQWSRADLEKGSKNDRDAFNAVFGLDD